MQRPQTFSNIIGQTELKSMLATRLMAAAQRSEVFPHTLLYGPPGLGKTTFANVIANARNARTHTITGPNLRKAEDLTRLLSQLQENDIIFIDEIHMMKPALNEILYPAMEDFILDMNVGLGQNAQHICINLPNFTLIGATTHPGKLKQPLRDRFGIQGQLKYYNQIELESIIENLTTKMDIQITKDSLKVIAKCSRGTPRIAISTLNCIYDYATSTRISLQDNIKITYQLTKDIVSNVLGLDALGLTNEDRMVMDAIVQNGYHASLPTICAITTLDKQYVSECIEPYLLLSGLIGIRPKR